MANENSSRDDVREYSLDLLLLCAVRTEVGNANLGILDAQSEQWQVGRNKLERYVETRLIPFDGKGPRRYKYALPGTELYDIMKKELFPATVACLLLLVSAKKNLSPFFPKSILSMFEIATTEIFNVKELLKTIGGKDESQKLYHFASNLLREEASKQMETGRVQFFEYSDGLHLDMVEDYSLAHNVIRDVVKFFNNPQPIRHCDYCWGLMFITPRQRQFCSDSCRQSQYKLNKNTSDKNIKKTPKIEFVDADTFEGLTKQFKFDEKTQTVKVGTQIFKLLEK